MAHIKVKVRIEDEDGNCSEASFVLVDEDVNNKKFMKSIGLCAAQAWNTHARMNSESKEVPKA